MSKSYKLKVSLSRVEVTSDPPIDIFHASFSNQSGVWQETFGSEPELKTFLRGIGAGVALMGGVFTMPEVPRQAAFSVQTQLGRSNWEDFHDQPHPEDLAQQQ